MALWCRRSDDQQLLLRLLCRLRSKKVPSRGVARPQCRLHAEELEKATHVRNPPHHRRRDDINNSDDDGDLSIQVFVSFCILGFSYISWPHILPIHLQYYPTSSPVLRCPSCFPSPSLHTFLSPSGIARAYQDWRKRGRCNLAQCSWRKATSAKAPQCELTRSPLNHKRVKGCLLGHSLVPILLALPILLHPSPVLLDEHHLTQSRRNVRSQSDHAWRRWQLFLLIAWLYLSFIYSPSSPPPTSA